MQNEKLFDRIRQTALTETSGTDDFDPEKVWSSIQQKDSRGAGAGWWPYVAASVALVLLGWWYLPQKEQGIAVLDAKPTRPLQGEKLPDQVVTRGGSLVISSEPTIAKTIKMPMRVSPASVFMQHAVETDTVATRLAVHPTQIFESPVLALADSVVTEPAKRTDSAQKTERVLVATITLPEQEADPSSGLKRMYDQIRKDREVRKMRVQINRQVGRATLWSFVHQSFVESPPAQSDH